MGGIEKKNSRVLGLLNRHGAPTHAPIIKCTNLDSCATIAALN